MGEPGCRLYILNGQTRAFWFKLCLLLPQKCFLDSGDYAHLQAVCVELSSTTPHQVVSALLPTTTSGLAACFQKATSCLSIPSLPSVSAGVLPG